MNSLTFLAWMLFVCSHVDFICGFLYNRSVITAAIAEQQLDAVQLVVMPTITSSVLNNVGVLSKMTRRSSVGYMLVGVTARLVIRGFTVKLCYNPILFVAIFFAVQWNLNLKCLRLD